MRTGLFGGAFNPPHLGHLVCAQEARARLGLERVVWMPVGAAPHRDIPSDPGPEMRARLCELAVAGDDRFEVSRSEVEREGPSYTADTLRELAERVPAEDVVLILGGDQAAALPTWHRPDEVLRLATVAVAGRGEHDRTRVERALDGHEARLEFFEMPRLDVSSTLVRDRVAAGLPVDYLVPAAVVDAIEAEGLYRSAVTA